jgi:hypothetical protein
MPAATPSLAVMRNAAQIAAQTGCVVEIDRKTGNVRILPPEAIPAHRAAQGGNTCDQVLGESD